MYMNKRIFWFLFFFIYLIGAELPFLIILFNRNIDQSSNLLFVLILLLISILINIVIFSLLKINIKKLKKAVINAKNIDEFNDISQNKIKEALSDFFAIFLLPFFTFNFSNNTPVNILLVEILFIFILLTIFIYRTNNLTTNILIYMIFNVYNCKIPGENFTLISTDTKTDIESDSIQLIKIFDKFYLYSSDYNDLNKRITLTIVTLVSLFIIFIIYTIFKQYPLIITEGINSIQSWW